jgi:hypothetical protein
VELCERVGMSGCPPVVDRVRGETDGWPVELFARIGMSGMIES